MAIKEEDEPAKVTGSTALEIDMPVDAEKLKEIHACLAKGRLKISVTKVDLATGRLGDGYKYD